MNKEKRTANYIVLPAEGGNKYQFFCDLTGAAICVSDTVSANTPEEELFLAWEQYGKHKFNQCHKCGKWVIDTMYNPDVLNCVNCTPIEDYPAFCPKCGAKTRDRSLFCHMCGFKLMYGGEWSENDRKDKT